MITIKMTQHELNALLSLAMDRLLEKENPMLQDALEWTDVVSGEKVTIDDLVTLLSRGGYR